MNKEKSNKILLAVLVVGGFLTILNQTLLNVALSDLKDIFNVSSSTVQWLATGFMLVNGVLIPITAFLMKRFSTRQLFISAMLFLLVGSIISAVAFNFSTLLIGRMVQAAGAGIIMPLMMNVIMFIFPVEKRGSMMGMIGLAMIFAPAIAPTLAGFVIEYISWRWLFIGMIPLAVVVILFAMKYLMNVTETVKEKLDIFSVILSTFGVGFVLYGFSSAGSRGWGDSIVISTIVLGLIITAIFCIRQLKSTNPLLNLYVFKNKIFTIASLINVVITMLMYADMILLPMYLQEGRGFTALDAGLLLMPGAIVNALMSPVTGKIYDKLGAKPVFIIGLIFIIPSMWVVTDLTSDTSFTFLVIRTIFLRIGLSFMSMPLTTASLNALPKELIGHGTAVNNTIRQIAGAIGTAVVVTIFSTQTKSHATELIQSGTAMDSVKTLAMMLGAGDGYYFMTVLAVIALILTLLLPSKKKMKTLQEQ